MRATRKRQRLTAWLAGDGIEIGALHNPLPVPDEARVTYVDRLTREELETHYPELGSTIGRHSVIGDAEDLSAFEDCSVDFVIANHLIEHLENPIRGLREFHRVLRDGGILYLAVPDARVTFDRRRPLTSVEHILSEYREGAEPNRRDHYREWVELVERDVLEMKSASRAPEERTEHLLGIGYSIHFHVWRPETFLDFYQAAKREAGLDFELVAYATQDEVPDDEFILVLAKGSSPTPRRPPPHRDAPPDPYAGLPLAARLRARVRESPVGPYLVPAYRRARDRLRRLRRS